MNKTSFLALPRLISLHDFVADTVFREVITSGTRRPFNSSQGIFSQEQVVEAMTIHTSHRNVEHCTASHRYSRQRGVSGASSNGISPLSKPRPTADCLLPTCLDITKLDVRTRLSTNGKQFDPNGPSGGTALSTSLSGLSATSSINEATDVELEDPFDVTFSVSYRDIRLMNRVPDTDDGPSATLENDTHAGSSVHVLEPFSVKLHPKQTVYMKLSTPQSGEAVGSNSVPNFHGALLVSVDENPVALSTQTASRLDPPLLTSATIDGRRIFDTEIGTSGPLTPESSLSRSSSRGSSYSQTSGFNKSSATTDGTSGHFQIVIY